MSHFDFANLLFSGPCNACCPTCIGKQIDPRLNTNNLDEYPPRNLERFKHDGEVRHSTAGIYRHEH